jgi:hypothetical protein
VQRPKHYFNPEKAQWPEVLELRLEMPVALQLDYGVRIPAENREFNVEVRELTATITSAGTCYSAIVIVLGALTRIEGGDDTSCHDGGNGGTGGTGGSPTMGTGAMASPVDCPEDGDLTAIADTYIRGDGSAGVFSDTSFGTSNRFPIKSVLDQSFTRKIYIAFDVSPPFDPDNPGFSNAYLILSLRRHIGNVNPATEPGPQPVDVFGISDDNDWDPAQPAEDEITWNNAPRNVTAMPSEPQFEQSPGVPLLIAAYDFDVPPKGEVDLGTESEPEAGNTQYALDITAYVKERLENDADGKITVLMAAFNPMNINQEGSDFWSLQAPDECNRPFLHFE